MGATSHSAQPRCRATAGARLAVHAALRCTTTVRTVHSVPLLASLASSMRLNAYCGSHRGDVAASRAGLRRAATPRSWGPPCDDAIGRATDVNASSTLQTCGLRAHGPAARVMQERCAGVQRYSTVTARPPAGSRCATERSTTSCADCPDVTIRISRGASLGRRGVLLPPESARIDENRCSLRPALQGQANSCRGPITGAPFGRLKTHP